MKRSGVDVGALQVVYNIKTSQLYAEAQVYEDESNVIRINPVYLMGHVDDFIEHVIPHEYAHLAAYRTHGMEIRPHGPEWRRFMDAMGLPALQYYEWELPPGWESGPRNRMIRVSQVIAGCVEQNECQDPVPLTEDVDRSNYNDDSQ